MPEEKPVGCARPTGGIVGEEAATEQKSAAIEEKRGEKAMIAVGKKAPDFTAPAYLGGKFVSVRLSEYLGKWVALCFYPGDFTFV